jgi:polysaccharide pyruvyl transferase WcaK-like protein
MAGPPPPRRIAFWGNFGTRNLGNECTLRAAILHARRRLPDAQLSCFCTAPEDAQARHGISCFPMGDTAQRLAAATGPFPLRLARRLGAEVGAWRDSLRHTRGQQLLVMTGTGMLTDEGEGALGFAYDVFRWAVAARLSGCRVAFLSVGVESIGRPLTRLFLRTALRLASYRSYRDTQSRERLRAAGFFSPRDVVAPDLAFSLPGTPSHPPPAPTPGRPPVAVGLYAVRGRGARGGEDAKAYRGYLDKVCTLVEQLRARGHALRLIVGDNTYDEPVLEDVRQALAARGVAVGAEAGLETTPAGDFEELLQQLAGVQLVVASRFHNVLLALLLGRPVVSLSYNEKNDALMAEVGLGRFCQPVDSFDVARTLEQLAELEQHRGPLLAVVAATAARYREALEVQYDAVFLARPVAA